MKDKFERILENMWKSAKDRDIKPIIGRLADKGCVPSDEIKEMIKIKSVDELRINLGVKYWSYLDIDNLNLIMEEQCKSNNCEDLEQEYSEYITKLKHLKQRRVSEFPYGLFLKVTSNAGMCKTSITLDIHDPTLMWIIGHVKSRLSSILGCLSNQLILHQIDHGSIEVTFLMKKALAMEIFEGKSLTAEQKRALTAEYITTIKYESNVIFCSVNQLEYSKTSFEQTGISIGYITRCRSLRDLYTEGRHAAARFRKRSDRRTSNAADLSAGPLERFVRFLLPLTFRLTEFFIVSFQRSRTATSYTRFFVENSCQRRNADLTFNCSAHHAYALNA